MLSKTALSKTSPNSTFTCSYYSNQMGFQDGTSESLSGQCSFTSSWAGIRNKETMATTVSFRLKALLIKYQRER